MNKDTSYFVLVVLIVKFVRVCSSGRPVCITQYGHLTKDH